MAIHNDELQFPLPSSLSPCLPLSIIVVLPYTRSRPVYFPSSTSSTCQLFHCTDDRLARDYEDTVIKCGVQLWCKSQIKIWAMWGNVGQRGDWICKRAVNLYANGVNWHPSGVLLTALMRFNWNMRISLKSRISRSRFKRGNNLPCKFNMYAYFRRKIIVPSYVKEISEEFAWCRHLDRCAVRFFGQRNIERSCVFINRQCSRLEVCRRLSVGALARYYLGVLTPRDIGDGMHRPAWGTTGRKHIKKTALTNDK